MLPIEGIQQRVTVQVVADAKYINIVFYPPCIRYFSDTRVVFRLLNNLLYHEDFQFPDWNIEE